MLQILTILLQVGVFLLKHFLTKEKTSEEKFEDKLKANESEREAYAEAISKEDTLFVSAELNRLIERVRAKRRNYSAR